VSALHRKLRRDLRHAWSQALTIALVVASGVAGFLTSLSAVDSLAAAREAYYRDSRFADLFCELKRAPAALEAVLRETPGVADVQATVEEMVRATVPGSADPVIGRLIGVDAVRHPARMNLVTLRAGRGLSPPGAAGTDGALEALASEGFARARGLGPGDRVEVLMDGRRRTLRIVGLAISPEYVFGGLWGMPDLRGFGVFWVDRDALAAAYGMHDAFDHLAVRLAPGARAPEVAARLQAALGRYGGSQVIGREDQVSNAMLDNEIAEQRVIGTILPAIFLGVAAFLLDVVVSRLVATQREQVATLKAIGYGNRAIALHYLQFVLLVVALGLAIGVLAGDRLGTLFTQLYADFFRFPRLEHRLAPGLLAVAVGVSAVTAVAGTLGAILATVRLSPAEAMRPPAPARFRPALLERLGVHRLPPALRMIARNLERRPWRALVSIGGIAAALAIVVLGNFFRDAIDAIADDQFRLGLRGDVAVWTVEAVTDSARLELARVPGVRAVESTRFVPVLFVRGTRRERGLLRGYAGRAELYRVIADGPRAVPLEGRGLVMGRRLADKLGLAPGEAVDVEVLEGRERHLRLTLVATVDEMMGLNAYVDRRLLGPLVGEGDLSGGFVLSVEPGREAQVLARTRELPRVAGVFSKATMLRNMQEISARNVRITSSVLTAFAAIIAVGVVYNNARIALAERGWELASLRVLGFTRAEVSAILLGELALVVALAVPLGMGLGVAMVHGATRLVESDQFHFPAVVSPRTLAWAALCVLLAAVGSALAVRRRVDALDLVAVLKTRD